MTTEVQQFDSHYIGGTWVRSRGIGFSDVVNPATEEVIAKLPKGNAADVDAAVAAAQKALPSWSAMPVEERIAIMRRVQAGLEERTETIIETLAREMGSPLWFGKMVQVPLPLNILKATISAMEELALQEEIAHSLVLREPVGVVASITPWNVPLHQIICKAAPALLAGCTMVFKPSVVTPLTAFILVEVLREAGVPAGVFNVVFGSGAMVGEALVTHPAVDMVSFTGSVGGGQRVAELAGKQIKKVSLELGGKSATILLDDAPFEQAAEVVLRQCFANTGQVCSAQTRLLVPRARLQEVEQLLVRGAEAWKVGDPLAEDTRLGPSATATQRDQVLHYIEQGIKEGAHLIYGGSELAPELLRGFYVNPTIFSNVTPDMTIAREEIFGPVLAVMPYDTEDEAIEIANGIPLGLSGGVWSSDKQRAIAVARHMRTGQVVLNGAPANFAAPFGGVRQSGIGREYGRFGIEEFLQYKAIQGGV
nr:aldehyde dehydrogenase family protein [uncultured Pseudogulbenkiania sp.]